MHAGIGKSLAWKLAAQGLNVVVVALDDQLLSDTVEELKSAFPKCKFVKVGALSPPCARLKALVEHPSSDAAAAAAAEDRP